jgi:hypothetical protein
MRQQQEQKVQRVQEQQQQQSQQQQQQQQQMKEALAASSSKSNGSKTSARAVQTPHLFSQQTSVALRCTQQTCMQQVSQILLRLLLPTLLWPNT